MPPRCPGKLTSQPSLPKAWAKIGLSIDRPRMAIRAKTSHQGATVAPLLVPLPLFFISKPPHGRANVVLVRAWTATWAWRRQAAKIAYGGLHDSGGRHPEMATCKGTVHPYQLILQFL